MIFRIVPYVSVGPLKWGMLPAEVERAIGAPSQVSKNRGGERVELREADRVSCIYQAKTNKLVEVGFSRVAGVALFDELDLNVGPGRKLVLELLRRDGSAARGFGTFVFPALGISLHGYLPENPDAKGATAFVSDRWDEVLPLMTERLPKV